MNHIGTKCLETDRLILRRFAMADTQDMFYNWASDAQVTKFLMWQPHQTIEDTQQYLQSVVANYESGSFYQWAITLKESGAVIGSIGVVDCNEKVNNVHIGYCISRQWWGRCITAEAFSRIISFLFTEVGVNRIDSRHDPKNPNSGKVMQKCGLCYEGTHRQSDINNSGICDAAWYGLLKDEYKT